MKKEMKDAECTNIKTPCGKALPHMMFRTKIDSMIIDDRIYVDNEELSKV